MSVYVCVYFGSGCSVRYHLTLETTHLTPNKLRIFQRGLNVFGPEDSQEKSCAVRLGLGVRRIVLQCRIPEGNHIIISWSLNNNCYMVFPSSFLNENKSNPKYTDILLPLVAYPSTLCFRYRRVTSLSLGLRRGFLIDRWLIAKPAQSIIDD